MFKNKKPFYTPKLDIEFAQLHVQEALKQATNTQRAEIQGPLGLQQIVRDYRDKQSILNAYNLDNIK